MFDDQSPFQARFDWGEAGLSRLGSYADVVVVVDVLSFGTAVDVALSRDAIVYPFAEHGPAAACLADSLDAILAADRAGGDSISSYSLSPASLLLIPAGVRLVLPSPNGAMLLRMATDLGLTALAGCLRNATAVAAACRALGDTVAVIAAGERWHGALGLGQFRPAVEDLVGAGAILTALPPWRPSPEAIAAMAAFHAARSALQPFLTGCASGRELIERGFAQDIALAAQLDASATVPILDGAALVAWTGCPDR